MLCISAQNVFDYNYTDCYVFPLAIVIKSEFVIDSEDEENLSEIIPATLCETVQLKSRRKEGNPNLIIQRIN